MNIEGKVALITGAGHVKGIGYAIVRQLLGKRVKGVGILDINDENGREVLDILQNEFGEHRVIYVNCDVTSKTDLEGAFEKVKTHFGRLDIVCNNAGIQNEVNWELTLNINLMGTIRGTYLALEHMGVNYGGRGGIVINTASIAGIMTTSHFPVYGASKHGIVAFTRNTASNRTFKENKIRVSAFCPAKVDTPIQDADETTIPDFKDFQALNDSVSWTPSTFETMDLCLLAIAQISPVYLMYLTFTNWLHCECESFWKITHHGNCCEAD